MVFGGRGGLWRGGGGCLGGVFGGWWMEWSVGGLSCRTTLEVLRRFYLGG